MAGLLANHLARVLPLQNKLSEIWICLNLPHYAAMGGPSMLF